MDGTNRFRVANNTNYDVGITLTSGQKPIIRAGSFLPMTVDDILYLESIARERKPFSSGDLVILDNSNNRLTLEEIGGYTDPYAQKHYDRDEIEAMLKKPVKQIEKWLDEITDPVELYPIAKIAQEMDLAQSKMKLILAKVPDPDLLGE